MKWEARRLGLVAVGDAPVVLRAAGPLVEAVTYHREQGGMAVLAALEASRRGLEVALATRVSEDGLGQWQLTSFEERRLHLDYTRQVAGRTAVVLEGEPRSAISFREASVAATLEPGDLAGLPWEEARWVLVTGPTQALSESCRRTVREALVRAREKGARTLYDPGLVPGLWPAEALALAAWREVAPLCDCLVLTVPYASGRLFSQPTAEPAAREALRRGVPQVVVRDPQGGSVVGEAGEVATLLLPAGTAPAPPGVFHGALVAAMVAGASLLEATREAQAAPGPVDPPRRGR
jgi:2-dehydro-3-deoxygluconokinase